MKRPKYIKADTKPTQQTELWLWDIDTGKDE
jgi:hypothetical protein